MLAVLLHEQEAHHSKERIPQSEYLFLVSSVAKDPHRIRDCGVDDIMEDIEANPHSSGRHGPAWRMPGLGRVLGSVQFNFLTRNMHGSALMKAFAFTFGDLFFQ